MLQNMYNAYKCIHISHSVDELFAYTGRRYTVKKILTFSLHFTDSGKHNNLNIDIEV